MEDLEKKRLEVEIKKLRDEIENYDDNIEDTEQTLRLLRDQIEETDENVFNLQKEKEEKEKAKAEIEARKAKDIKEQQAKEEDKKAEGQDSDANSEEPGSKENEEIDNTSYKKLLKTVLAQKIDDIVTVERQHFDEVRADKKMDAPEKPRVHAVYVTLKLDEADNRVENFEEFYKEDGIIELTHSFRISSLSTLESLQLAAVDYYGVNAARYVLCYMRRVKNQETKKTELVLESLAEFKDWTVDKCIKLKKMKEAVFYLIKQGSKLIGPVKSEPEEKKHEARVGKIIQPTHKEDYIEREKTLCMYHGLNHLYQTYGDREVTEYTKSWQTHLATAFFVFLLLILTIVTLTGRRDLKKEFWLTNAIEKQFREPAFGIPFEDVTTILEIWMFLENTLGDFLFTNQAFRSNNYINKLRLRVLRTKSHPCKIKTSMTCYYTEYNSETADTTDIMNTFTGKVWLYRTAEQNEISGRFIGQFSSYDGSGNTQDYVVQNSSGEYFKDDVILGRDKDNQIITPATRALVATYSFYNIPMDLIVSVNMLFEISVAGSVNPTYLGVRAFPPSMTTTNRDKAIFSLDIIRLVLSFYFLICLIASLGWYSSKRKLLTFSCFLDSIGYLLIPGILIAIVALVKNFSDYSADEIIGGTKAVKLSGQSTLYDAIFGLEAVLLFVLIYRMLCLFRLNPYFDLIYLAVSNSMGLLISYAVLLFGFLASCTMLSQVLWGTFHTNYRSFAPAFFYTALTMIGGADYSIWIYKASSWSVVYYIFFFIWATFLLPNVCIGIFMENYRIAALEAGYPEDKKSLRWGVKGYLAWALGCCPLIVRKKLGLIETKPEERNEDDSS